MIIANKSLGYRAMELGLKEIGRGEDPALGNNRGHYVSLWKVEAGLAWVKDGDPWCAIFASAMLARVCGGFDKVPFKLYSGARKLCESAATMPGARWSDEPVPGALALFKRPGGMHVCFILEHRPDLGDRLRTLDGNKDKKRTWYGKVKRYALVDTFGHPQGSWRETWQGGVVLP